MKYDVIIIGAGIAGLTAGALLSKKQIKVCVIDAQFKPGGSCGIFKRHDAIFEQGSSMIYGFGEKGYSPHSFVFNVLEEPIDIIKHKELYAINYGEHKIIFYEDIDRFIEELVKVFPHERENFKRFYRDFSKLYMNVIAADPVFLSPDVVKKEKGLEQFKNHPGSYIKFLSFMNGSTEKMLKKYFKDPEVLKFFDKLTSTYCYTTVKETPAILSSIMFVDNHFGGSYYPSGSTLNFIGKLEKVIEENGGDMIYSKEVQEILVENKRVVGVRLEDGNIINANRVVNSGNVWNLYNKLLKNSTEAKKIKWANSLIATYPSVVIFALVKKEAIPKDTLPIEMLIDNKNLISEGEITVYIPSIDDKSLCDEGYHTVMAIGPSFKQWPSGLRKEYHSKEYEEQKNVEQERMLQVLEKRFPGFRDKVCHVELSTPATLERYALKHGGAVAGPKQQLGQHMLKRLKIKGDIEGLYNCGESTVMGTGTPAVTVSGISSANLILRDLGREEYEYSVDLKKYVNYITPPYNPEGLVISSEEVENELALKAMKCQFCEVPLCEKGCPKALPIRDINRRLAAGNFYGARKLMENFDLNPCKECTVKACEAKCIRKTFQESVCICDIITKIKN